NNFIYDNSIGLLIDTIFNLEHFSNSNIVTNNNFNHLATHGIALGANIDTYIEKNDFSFIREYAIHIFTEDSVNVMIEDNNFIGNNLVGLSQVYDDGTNSYFIGNYWSDQTEEGVYSIDGLSNNFFNSTYWR
ncbi:MAG: right-handed parallel beta-helix repeat-containing protein, partial [Candidatus Hodarchaeales archaeon]